MFHKNKLLPPAEAQLKEQMLLLFLSLGLTPNEIAASLFRHGIYGKKRDQQFCPVIRFLQRHGINAKKIRFGQGNDAIGILLQLRHRKRREQWFSTKHTPLIEPVREFVLAYDRGCYPELELIVGEKQNEL